MKKEAYPHIAEYNKRHLDGFQYLFDALKTDREKMIYFRIFACNRSIDEISEYEGVSHKQICKILKRIDARIKRLKLVNHVEHVQFWQEKFTGGYI